MKKLSKTEHSGYDLMRELGMTLGKKPSPGYIYPLLKDLKNKKFIKENKKGNKNIYSITNKGDVFLKELLKRQEETLHKMIETIRPLSDKKEINDLTKMFKSFKKNEFKITKDWDILITLKKEIIHVFENDYENKREEFRLILNETFKKLSNLNKK